MKFDGHFLFILFFDYLHVDAIKFDCSEVEPLKKNSNLLQKLNGKINWIVKYPGYKETENYKKMLGRVYRTYSSDVIIQTSYYINPSKKQTLHNQKFRCDLHDELFATFCTLLYVNHTYAKLKKLDCRTSYKFPQRASVTFHHLTQFNRLYTTLKYNETMLVNPSRNLWNLNCRTEYQHLALVHYTEIYDFYIFQDCKSKNANVEVGDEIYRKIIGDDAELQYNLTASISEALNTLGLDDVNYTQANDLLNIHFLDS